MGRLKERIYGAVFFFIGLAILWEGRGLTFGTFRSPASGLFPDMIAVIMLLLALLLIIFPPKSEGEGEKAGETPAEGQGCAPTPQERQAVSMRSAGRIAIVFAALLLYAFFLERLGFILVSLLLTTLLFVAFGSRRYWLAIVRAVVMTGLAYLLFETVLKSNLPRGIFGS